MNKWTIKTLSAWTNWVVSLTLLAALFAPLRLSAQELQERERTTITNSSTQGPSAAPAVELKTLPRRR